MTAFSKNTKILRSSVAALALLLAAPTATMISADHHGDRVSQAVANSNRNPENMMRDSERKAGEVMRFYEVKAGDTVLDLFSGRGYLTEVFSGVVGDKGKVYAHQRAGVRFDRIKDKLTEHYKKFDNIELMVSADGTLDLPDDSVDMVMLSLILHHMHFSPDAPDQLPERSKALFAEIQRVLKPGGTFGVIEHAAAKGASRQDSNDWHRIDPEMAIADLTSVGFEFVGSSDMHTNPDDKMMSAWGPAGMRGKTTRLVQKYISPK